MRYLGIMFLITAAVCLVACSDDDNPVRPKKTFFSITVLDAQGQPVEGLRVGSINHPISGRATGAFSGKPCPSTEISFSLPAASDWELTVHDYHGSVVKLFTGYSSAGTTIVIWDGADSAGLAVPSGFYRFHLEAGAYESDVWRVLETGPDPHLTIIGALDHNGTYATNNKALFPGILASQPIEYYTDTVTIHLSDPDYPDDFFYYTTRLNPDGNSFSFALDSLGLPGPLLKIRVVAGDQSFPGSVTADANR
jgi:hypothetical protein